MTLRCPRCPLELHDTDRQTDRQAEVYIISSNGKKRKRVYNKHRVPGNFSVGQTYSRHENRGMHIQISFKKFRPHTHTYIFIYIYK
jgi:hypothetical protein